MSVGEERGRSIHRGCCSRDPRRESNHGTARQAAWGALERGSGLRATRGAPNLGSRAPRPPLISHPARGGGQLKPPRGLWQHFRQCVSCWSNSKTLCFLLRSPSSNPRKPRARSVKRSPPTPARLRAPLSRHSRLNRATLGPRHQTLEAGIKNTI